MEGPDPLTPKQENLYETLNIVTSLTLGLTLLLSTIFIYFINLKIIRHITPAAVTMLVGGFVGIFPIIFPSATIFESLTNFNPNLFYFGLLPLIIFECGFSLDQKAFKRNFWAIILFAILGTIISFCVLAIGLVCVGYKLFGFEGDFYYTTPFILIFSALISSIDPIATFSIFSEYRPKPVGEFFSILSGESVLNDAVSIILTKSLTEAFFKDKPEIISFISIIEILLDFLYNTVFSLLIGIAFGAICSFIFKQSRLNKMPEVELFLTLTFAYLSYATAESLSLSGIVTLFFNGIVLRHYNYHNLSHRGRTTSTYIFKAISFSFEQIIYALIGFTIIQYIATRQWNLYMIGISFLLCLIGRAIHIFPFSYLLNLARSTQRKITINQQVMMFISGLRGGVGFTLAVLVTCPDDKNLEMCKTNRDIILTTTLAIVIITTLFVGSTIEFFAHKMKLFSIGPHTDTHTHSEDEFEQNLHAQSEQLFACEDEHYISIDDPHQNLMEESIIPPRESRIQKILYKAYRGIIYIEKTYLKVYLGAAPKKI